MSDLDLAYASATKLAGMIRDRQLSSVEAVGNALARIDEVNEALNCFCFIYGEEALTLARAADRRLARGAPDGPLHGVPIAIKDFTPMKGKRTTQGSLILEHWVPDKDPIIVARLRAAGAIVIGKTTTPEFAHSGFTESALWGLTRNPWDLSRTPGGSSGGSAAAVSAGCVPIAEGTDMGGSVRIPAAYCGLVGLKPSLGRIPMDIIPSVFDNIPISGRWRARSAMRRCSSKSPTAPTSAISCPTPAASTISATSRKVSRDCGSRSARTSATTP